MRGKRKVLDFFPVTTSKAVFIEGSDKTLDDIINKNEINVKAFGSKGDGLTDDTQAIKNAVTACANFNKREVKLFFPKSKGYLTSDTINIPDGVDVIMESPIIYNGPEDRVALNIGNDNSHNREIDIDAQVIGKVDRLWSNDNCVGIRIVNAYGCRISLGKIANFTKGVVFEAINGLGFTMNEVNMVSILNCKYGVQVCSTNKGWANANNYYGGFFGKASTENPDKEFYGILINSPDGSYPGTNSNNFYGPRFEGGPKQLPIYCEGVSNTFNNIRAENTSTVCLMKSKGELNKISGAHIQTKLAYNVVNLGYKFDSYYKVTESLLYSRHMVEDMTTGEGGVINSNQLYFFNYYGNPQKTSEANKYELVPEGLKMTSPSSTAIITKIKTDLIKEFRIVAALQGKGRLLLKCYDENGAVLNGEERPITEDDVFGINLYAKKSGAGFMAHPGWGGCYYQQSDSNQDCFEETIRVSPETKKIEVGIVLLYENTILNKLDIYARDTEDVKSLPFVYY